MEIRVLRSFVTVAESLSFSAAARQLNIAQPAISRQVASLEEELGVQLLWRTKREVKVTAAGLSLLREAREILAREQWAREQARRTAAGELGRVRVGYLSSASFSFLPELVRGFCEQHSSVEVTLHEMTPTEQAEAFAADRIDVGLSRSLPEAARAQYRVGTLYLDSLYAALPSDHRLATREPIALESLAEERFVLFSRRSAPGLFDAVTALCVASGFSPRVECEVGTMQTVLTQVAAGLGVSVVPGCVRKLFTQGVRFVELRGEVPSIPLEIQWRRAPESAAVRAFVDSVLAAQKSICSHMSCGADGVAAGLGSGG